MKRESLFLLAVSIITFFCAPSATAQEKAASRENYGSVSFPVSCGSETQQQFNRAVAMLHSFGYPTPVKAFTEITQKDPNCAMAYWGLAMSQRINPLVGPPDAKAIQTSLEAIEKAKAVGAKSERERAYIAAIEQYYKDADKVSSAARALAYEKAMEQVYVRYPEDREAAVFYALALNEAADPSDNTYSKQLKAAAILERVLAAQPEHPGVLHYLIHSYDYPALAPRGVNAALKYSQVAPAAPHALHMPAHIFSVLGMWQESINSNRASAAKVREEGNEQPFHAMDFMMYAYLQMAQDQEAKRLLDERNEVQNYTPNRISVDTANAAIAARYALERGAWSEAASLPPRPSKWPAAEAITYFVRGMGEVRMKDGVHAEQDLDKLRSLHDALVKANDKYWAEQVDIQERALSAWLLRLDGKNDQAVNLMRSAADLEEASGKHVAMENRLWPMRELFGELLLDLNQPAQALKEFEASLRVAANRFRSYYGAAKAAELSGDKEKTKVYFTKLLAVAEKADTERAEIKEAKMFLARQ